MPRGRKPKVAKELAKPPNTLLIALEFVALAQRKIGAIETTHCRLSQGWCWASNGIITAAHPVQEPLEVCPNTFSLIDALEQSPAAASLTVLEPTKLSVTSEAFQAVIPCVEATALPSAAPDAAVALCDDRLKRAMTLVGTLATDGAAKLLNASIQLRPGTALASDGVLILEAWHGIDLPPLMFAPKSLVTALNKVSYPITRLGVSDSSVTLWFENGAWLKAQLYPQPAIHELPDFYRYLNLPSYPVPVPKELFAVAKRLKPFSADGMLYVLPEGAKVFSADGATYAGNAIEGVPPGIAFSIERLLTIAPFCQTIHFLAGERTTLFFGENVRGCIVTDVQNI